jgi:DNA-binding XRE family transcriptional regulator
VECREHVLNCNANVHRGRDTNTLIEIENVHVQYKIKMMNGVAANFSGRIKALFIQNASKYL